MKLFIVVDTSNDNARIGKFFSKKEDAKEFRDGLNLKHHGGNKKNKSAKEAMDAIREAGGNFRYQIRKGPDHMRAQG